MLTGDVKYKPGHYSLVFTLWFCFIFSSAVLVSKCSVIIAFNWVENKTVDGILSYIISRLNHRLICLKINI